MDVSVAWRHKEWKLCIDLTSALPRRCRFCHSLADPRSSGYLDRNVHKTRSASVAEQSSCLLNISNFPRATLSVSFISTEVLEMPIFTARFKSGI